MKITKERLKRIIQEELEAIVEGDGPFRGPKFSPTQTGVGVPVSGRDAVSGRPLRQQAVMSAEPPVENLEADAQKIIDKARDFAGMFAGMGVTNTVRIHNPELKALVLDMAPDLADRIS